MLLTDGQMNDCKRAVPLFSRLFQAKELLADKGYDKDWFRHAFASLGLIPCIPQTANRKFQQAYGKQLYRQRHKIENLFARLKDWRRIATRYDRCVHTFMSAITIAATLCF
jgi:transposase